MTTSSINFNSEKSSRKNYYKRQIKVRFGSKRAEIIAWALFMGVGVVYFIATLISATL